MIEAARIDAVIEVIKTYSQDYSPLDAHLSFYFKARRYIGSKDRQAIATRVYGIFRNYAHISWWALLRGVSLSAISSGAAARLQVLAYLMEIEKIDRAKIGIWFDGEKYSPSKLNDKERQLVGLDLGEPNPPLWVRGEFPEWLQPALQDLYGDQLLENMQAFQKEAPVDIRANTLKINRENLKVKLKAEKIIADALPDSETALRLKDRQPLTSTKAFRDGLFEIQDLGSQKIAESLQATPGMSVLDLCAGAGGKTLAVAALMENKGKIVAMDIANWRLQKARLRLKRADVNNTECRVLDEEGLSWLKRQKGRFDRILIDAPCSGTGTWRRNPEQKWRLTPDEIERLIEIQEGLIHQAAPLLKPNGKIVYATCSILKDENENVVQAFLKKTPKFQLESQVRLAPLQNGTDGFFIATISKIE
ncbi:Ribosomal RNA small subunit methyltransferase B [Candidatus Bealeia paramacronuclearis]|uniref:Ribosomal RNA small subunit methyltransferase B n=1 Tax=Candidatus Bealeia paramacronuclearis TaxID=1921001 RepID=A0ABZ2C2L5_9PROT|nr:Ribosomal RNA small subunit methyltransferase B [Candidatus Bealeia paramacronuclearis]